MSDCVLFGLVAGVDNYTTKDGSSGCNLQVRSSSGKLYPFLVRQKLDVEVFTFGLPVTVQFNITFFNGKPNNLIASAVEVSQNKKEVK